MNPINITGTHPDIKLDAHANLDIKLDGWHGVAGVGIICTALVAALGLFLKFKA